MIDPGMAPVGANTATPRMPDAGGYSMMPDQMKQVGTFDMKVLPGAPLTPPAGPPVEATGFANQGQNMMQPGYAGPGPGPGPVQAGAEIAQQQAADVAQKTQQMAVGGAYGPGSAPYEAPDYTRNYNTAAYGR